MIVLDTSFLVALHNSRDTQHALALDLEPEFRAGRWGQAALLEYVLAETVTVMMLRCGLAQAVAAGVQLLNMADVGFVPCSGLFAPAFKAFAAQANTRLSLIDAAVAVFALRQAGGQILSFDREFHKIAGLKVWPPLG